MKLRIKEIIKEKGTTMSEVAERIGTKQAALSRAVSEDGNPTLSLLTRTADALGVDITELFSPKQPIIGVIIFNGATYRIENFDQLERLYRDYRAFINAK